MQLAPILWKQESIEDGREWAANGQVAEVEHTPEAMADIEYA